MSSKVNSIRDDISQSSSLSATTTSTSIEKVTKAPKTVSFTNFDKKTDNDNDDDNNDIYTLTNRLKQAEHDIKNQKKFNDNQNDNIKLKKDYTNSNIEMKNNNDNNNKESKIDTETTIEYESQREKLNSMTATYTTSSDSKSTSANNDDDDNDTNISNYIANENNKNLYGVIKDLQDEIKLLTSTLVLKDAEVKDAKEKVGIYIFI